LIVKRTPLIRTPSILRRKHSGTDPQEASFEVLDGGRSRAIGSLHFTTVSALLTQGIEAINSGRADVIDLADVTASDSSGLALLIEWLSVAEAAGRVLKFENVPTQLLQLARLSDVEELLVPPPPGVAVAPEAAALAAPPAAT
jgi:phospholipid transport system transporter-binding protein